ncbi:MAG: amidohydrolase [Bacteroidota bacterium]|nr:amidohydrolase [Bacteroidota bacterium]
MPSITISIIQTNLHWEDKNANLDMLSKKIESITEKTEVVILPEMFSTGFSMKPESLAEKMDGETISWMKRIAAEKKIILTGSVMIDPSTEAQDPSIPIAIGTQDKKYYNRLIWMLPNGEYGIYDKRHLFAYGNEHTHYSPGNKRLIASVKGWKINLQVCYDLRFPVWARQAAEMEYDILIYVANWPEKRSLAWKTLLQARAIENQCYVIGVNRVGQDGNDIHYSGDSMIIDAQGEILYQKKNEEDIFTYTLQKEKIIQVREKYPFWKDADSFIINC